MTTKAKTNGQEMARFAKKPITAGVGISAPPATGARGRTQQVRQFFQLIFWRRLRSAFEYWIPRFSKVETTPFIDPRQFEWHELVMSEWTKVRSELEAVLSEIDTVPRLQDITTEQDVLTTDDKWRAFFFYAFGHRSPVECAQCPQTAELLGKIPGMKTAFFSILLPGKRLPPHRGYYRGILRYHLPLLVPRNGDCGLRVGDQIIRWQDGVGIMFDDTYEHEAWNDTDQTRVILWLDIVRPMKFPFNLLNSAVLKLIGISPLVRNGRKRLEAWNRALENKSNLSTLRRAPEAL